MIVEITPSPFASVLRLIATASVGNGVGIIAISKFCNMIEIIFNGSRIRYIINRPFAALVRTLMEIH